MQENIIEYFPEKCPTVMKAQHIATYTIYWKWHAGSLTIPCIFTAMSQQWHSRVHRVTAVTFQNKLCHSSDIPEQSMPEKWHSRTNYVRVVTFQNKLCQKWHSRTSCVSVMTFPNTILLMCWCTAFINKSLYSVFNHTDKAPGDSVLLWGCTGPWVREALKSTASCILLLILLDCVPFF